MHSFDGRVNYLPIKVYSDRKGETVRNDSMAAINGQWGLKVLYSQDRPFHAGWSIPFRDFFWTRFSIRTVGSNIEKEDEFQLGILALKVSSFNDQYTYLVKGRVEKKRGESAKFVLSSRPAREPEEGIPLCTLDIMDGKARNIEIGSSFYSKDSLILELFSNGIMLTSKRLGYPAFRDSISFSFFRDVNKQPIRPYLVVNMDDFVISDKRVNPIPPTPLGGVVFPDSIPPMFDSENYIAQYSKSVIHFERVACSYQGEQIFRAQWCLYSMLGDDTIAISQSTTDDPSDFFRFVPSFPLDSGVYGVTLALQNNFDEWGFPSRLVTFPMGKRAGRIMTIDTVIIDNAQNNGIITVGTWFDIKLKLKKPYDKADFGYVLVYLRHDGYNGDFGPKQKGGAFNPETSYPINLSLSSDNKVISYERPFINSYKAETILPDSIGLYTDTREGKSTIDLDSGIISIRVRLLDEALSGRWKLYAYIRTSRRAISSNGKTELRENMSNLFIADYDVTKKKSSNKTIVIAFIIIMVVTLVVSLKMFKQKQILKTTTVDSNRREIVFRSLCDYISNHSSEKLAVPDICAAICISETLFYSIFREKGLRFSNYLNSLRIKKAKELLLSTEKTINDIAIEVGYVDPLYFSKIFHQTEGITASDYRKNGLFHK